MLVRIFVLLVYKVEDYIFALVSDCNRILNL